MPYVFLHGNPHIDNFAKTNQGEAMIDFDRSRVGPYAWDLVRFACSLSLRRSEEHDIFLAKTVIDHLKGGYIAGFENPYQTLVLPEVLPEIIPKESEVSTNAYLAANLKWAQKMRENPIFTSHPSVQSLVALYFKARREGEEAKRYEIEEAGTAVGSFGKPRILVVLSDTDHPEKDLIFLEIKEVYQDPDTEFFFNPFIHHGLRMIEASFLYAPDFEKGLGYLSWRNKQYWARQIPPFKTKFRGNLTDKQQEGLAYLVGVQIGRAHRKSLRECAPDKLLVHFTKTFPNLLDIGALMNEEIKDQWNCENPNVSSTTSSTSKVA